MGSIPSRRRAYILMVEFIFCKAEMGVQFLISPIYFNCLLTQRKSARLITLKSGDRNTNRYLKIVKQLSEDSKVVKCIRLKIWYRNGFGGFESPFSLVIFICTCGVVVTFHLSKLEPAVRFRSSVRAYIFNGRTYLLQR